MRDILRLPFAYEIDLQPPRKRGFRQCLVRDHAPVRLAVLDPSEFPAVFEMERGGIAETFRMHDGRLYRQVTADDGAGVTPEEFEEQAGLPRIAFTMRSAGRRWWDTGFFPDHEGLASVIGIQTLEEVLDSHHPREGVRIGSDDRERRMSEAIGRLGEGLLICEGEVWTAQDALEPHWSVEFEPSPPAIHLRLRRKAVPGAAGFSLERHGEAFAYGNDVAGAHLGAGAEIVDESPAHRILRRDLIMRDDLLSLAETVRRTVGGERGLKPWEFRAGTVPEPVQAASEALVGVVERAPEGMGRQDARAVLASLLAFHERCDDESSLPPCVEGPRSLTRGAARRLRFESAFWPADVMVPDEADVDAFAALGPGPGG